MVPAAGCLQVHDSVTITNALVCEGAVIKEGAIIEPGSVVGFKVLSQSGSPYIQHINIYVSGLSRLLSLCECPVHGSQ